jgi:hypothetical protein
MKRKKHMILGAIVLDVREMLTMGQVAKHSDEITDEMWSQVNSFNRDMV